MLYIVKHQAGILTLEVVTLEKLSIHNKGLDDISHLDELVLW